MRRTACLGLLLCATGLPALPAQTGALVVGVPAVFAEAARPLLQGWFGDELAVLPLLAVGTEPPPGVSIFLLCDEWLLARLQQRGALSEWPVERLGGADARPMAGEAFVLPFRAEYSVVLHADFQAQEATFTTWEELAITPALHDHLGIVGPEIDGSPWLLAMQNRLLRLEGEPAGMALWTTIDARAGRFAGSYAELMTGLADGSLLAAVVPRAVFEPAVAGRDGFLRVRPLAEPNHARFGLALAKAADPRAVAMVEQLLSATSLRALAAAAAMVTEVQSGPALGGADSLAFWQRFESAVRGRGRRVEAVADWLDLVFGAAFLVLLVLLLRSQRRREAGPSA